MKTLLSIALAVTLVPALAGAQDAAQAQKMFEAGQYKELIAAAPNDAPPAVVFLVGQSHERLRSKDNAREIYGRLEALPDTNPWHFIGMSAKQFLDSDIGNEREYVAAHNQAIGWAESASKLAPTMMEAYYMVGLILFDMSAWNEASREFEKAAELNPNFAYAHYYAGRSHRSAQRPERALPHFEAFLKLAPNAPERAEVQGLIKTLGGR
jgi:tetratricopeptide (TPR) repeat protein